jgi:hypothetical protein
MPTPLDPTHTAGITPVLVSNPEPFRRDSGGTTHWIVGHALVAGDGTDCDRPRGSR